MFLASVYSLTFIVKISYEAFIQSHHTFCMACHTMAEFIFDMNALVKPVLFLWAIQTFADYGNSVVQLFFIEANLLIYAISTGKRFMLSPPLSFAWS